MLKKITLVTALAAGLIASTAVLAHDHGPRGHHGRGGPVAGLKQLDLSDAQRDQVRKIMQDHRKASEPLREEQKALHKSFATLNPGSADYAKQVASLQDQSAKVARDRVKDIANLKGQVYAVLTDAQRAKWAEQKTNFRRHDDKPRSKN
ncbi:MAG: Spy/CpxP family protein refolding chaperone [Pseudomonadota bacterium]